VPGSWSRNPAKKSQGILASGITRTVISQIDYGGIKLIENCTLDYKSSLKKIHDH
jgi:hypothetical protein